MNSLKEDFSGKVVVVTGASGFIGAHLCRVLASYGANVIALVRFESNVWRLQPILSDIEVFKIDMLDANAIKDLFYNYSPRFLFHFAIPGHGALRDEHDLTKQKNITTTHLENLFNAIIESQIPLEAFVHACSGSIYKWDEAKPRVKEETPLSPATLRGKLKLTQRNVCLELAQKHGLSVKLARIFRVYGPMEVETKLITKALDAVHYNRPLPLGDAKFKRDYIYVDDLIQGLLLLANKKSDLPLELNFGGENQYSAVDIIHTMEGIMSVSVQKQLDAYPKNLFDQGGHVADCSKARQVLGWKPNTTLEKGLTHTIDWYKSYRKK